MTAKLPLGSVSIKGRLILSYLVILLIGGLATSLVGSYIVSSTILMQVFRMADNTLATARNVYDQKLAAMQQAVHIGASGTTIPQRLQPSGAGPLRDYLLLIRRDAGFDFLNLTGPDGRVTVRSLRAGPAGDDVSGISVVKAALSGKVAASTEILSGEMLSSEDPALGGRARMRLESAPDAPGTPAREETCGMVLVAAAPVRDSRGAVAGVLYGGILLNRNFDIVDRVYDLIFKERDSQSRHSGNVSIFQGRHRIATTVATSNGGRALGTAVYSEVVPAVLHRGEEWRGRALVVDGWHISRYAPIRNLEGKPVGVLSAGLLESTYTETRNRVILSFFGLAMIGFFFIIGITYYMISNITRPIGEMVAATRSIAAGRFDQEVATSAHGEIELLANSFNTMLKSLRQMKADLEEWGRTLEQKVRDRTEELVAMQARVAHSERLASVGMLAAGVAHEINNPLGAILSLTALTLEDIPPGDPNRENLEEVVKQSERCRGIVKGLLDFSRQSKVSTELIQLNGIIEETLLLISKQSLFFNINVVKHLDPGLPPVTSDAAQFQQVFMNIFVNAAQAMKERGTLTIVTQHKAGEGVAEVRVTDTGHGIPPEQVDLIFYPFFTTKESSHGTGLGLSIAYGIVSSHGGTIDVHSEVGKGTTFIIRMPAGSGAPEKPVL
ncbi:MAG: cache domain-containing protein [Bryobacteraceae bacterium]|nr:cache domain-containing protein [Bryobacteraceae bacterium]